MNVGRVPENTAERRGANALIFNWRPRQDLNLLPPD